jgi:hypothetical protein
VRGRVKEGRIQTTVLSFSDGKGPNRALLMLKGHIARRSRGRLLGRVLWIGTFLLMVALFAFVWMRHPQWRWGALGLAAAAVLIAVVSALVTVVPERLVRRDIGRLPGGRIRDHRQLSAPERLKAKSDARSSLLQSVTALGLVIGLVFTVLQVTSTQRSTQRQLELTQRQLQLTEEQQLDERFNRSVQSLSSQDLSIRLGSVYALENIAANERYRETGLGCPRCLRH